MRRGAAEREDHAANENANRLQSIARDFRTGYARIAPFRPLISRLRDKTDISHVRGF